MLHYEYVYLDRICLDAEVQKYEVYIGDNTTWSKAKTHSIAVRIMLHKGAWLHEYNTAINKSVATSET